MRLRSPFLLVLLIVATAVVASGKTPRLQWKYVAPKSDPNIQLNGVQLKADGAGGVVGLYQDNASGEYSVVWLNRFGKVLWSKAGMSSAALVAAHRNAIYINGRFSPEDADNVVLVVSRDGEETSVDSVESVAGVYFNFNDPDLPAINTPTDDSGFFAFSGEADPQNPDSPGLLTVVRFYIR